MLTMYALEYIEKLKHILSKLPHGERSEICDDIERFVTLISKKYKIKID